MYVSNRISACSECLKIMILLQQSHESTTIRLFLVLMSAFLSVCCSDEVTLLLSSLELYMNCGANLDFVPVSARRTQVMQEHDHRPVNELSGKSCRIRSHVKCCIAEITLNFFMISIVQQDRNRFCLVKILLML